MSNISIIILQKIFVSYLNLYNFNYLNLYIYIIYMIYKYIVLSDPMDSSFVTVLYVNQLYMERARYQSSDVLTGVLLALW